MKVGIVTGMIEEAAMLFGGQGQIEPDAPLYLRDAPGVMIACCGIGKVNGAMAASHLLNRGADLLLSVGVAGRLTDRDGDCFWLREAVQHDYGSVRDGGLVRYRAGSLPFGAARLEAFAAIADPGLGLPHARIATGDVFIEHADHSLRLADALEADLVDMETGALAQVADRHGKPWGGIRAVSDEADDRSGRDFQDNVRAAARLAAHHAERLVRLLHEVGIEPALP